MGLGFTAKQQEVGEKNLTGGIRIDGCGNSH